MSLAENMLTFNRNMYDNIIAIACVAGKSCV